MSEEPPPTNVHNTGTRSIVAGRDVRDSVIATGDHNTFNIGAPSTPAARSRVPPHNTFFTGRDAQLDALHEAFRGKGPSARKQAIAGLGGIGKTQLAVEYCHRYRADYSHVLWVKAATRENIESGFIRTAFDLNLPEDDEKDTRVTIAAMQDWLAHNTDYLLVLDGVANHEDVVSMLPGAASGRLLITTRIQDYAPFAIDSRLELRTLLQEDARDFLLHRSGRADTADDQERSEAADLVDALGCLPLAIEQASAFLLRIHNLAISAYLADFRKRKMQTFANDPDDALHANVATTWNINVDALGNSLAKGLLSVAAFVAPQDIPNDLARQYFKTAPSAAEKALEQLHYYSLIWRRPEDDTFSIHVLLQELARTRLPAPTQAAYAGQAVDILGKLFPVPDWAARADADRLLPHALACAEDIKAYGIKSRPAWKLLFNASVYLDMRSRHDTAEPVLKLAMDRIQGQAGVDAGDAETIRRIAEGATESDPLETARQLSKLAYQYYQHGNYAAAEPLFQRALDIHEKALGPEHPEAATSLNNLAVLYKHEGRADAEPLFLRALAIREKALGPDHPDTASSLNNLAAFRDDQGNYAAAELLLQRAIAIQEIALGADDPATGSSSNNLAELYRKQGNAVDAEPLYRRDLAICEMTVGPNHADTAVSVNNLALLYQAQGNRAAAEPLFLRALAIRENVLGLNHPDTASTVSNLAGFYYDQGNYSAAEPLYKRALAIREKVLGPNHPETAWSLNNLAEVYLTQGDYAAAELMFQRALDVREKALGPDHPHTVQSLTSLAGLYRNQGNYVAAEPLYQRALGILEKALGPDHPDTARSLNNLAGVCQAQGNYAAAESLYQRALAILEKALGPNHPDTAMSLNNLAGLYKDQGNYAAAEPLHQRALAILEKAFRPDHPRTITARNNYAALREKMDGA